MNSEHEGEEDRRFEESHEDRTSKPSTDDYDVVSTSDPVVTSGRVPERGQHYRADETMVAETSRITQSNPSYTSDPKAFVETGPAVAKANQKSNGKPKDQDKRGQADSQGRRDDNGGENRDSSDRKPETRSGSPLWVNLLITGVVAAVCGIGGAYAFSSLDGSNSDDSKQSKKKSDSKSGGDSKSSGKSKGSGSSTSDSGSEIPGFTSSEDSDTFKKQIAHVSSRLDTIQQRVETLATPQTVTPPDLGTLQIKMGDLSRSINEVSGLPSKVRLMENKVDRLQEELKGLREQLSNAKERGEVTTGAATIRTVDRRVDEIAGRPPTPPSSILPSSADSPDAAMAQAIAYFKDGRYPLANDMFRKLQLTRPQDARVWYYASLASGLTNGNWNGEPKRLVEQGAEREKAGLPSASQIDAAFSGLSPEQGRDWLNGYRERLLKR